jgi:uncharacterized protein YuzE
MIVLDLDAEGRLIGIEVLGARKSLPNELLAPVGLGWASVRG